MAALTQRNINEFQEKLLDWFFANGRHFPWRDQGITPYQAIIAEVLLQRTKAGTVANFYKNFLQEFPNWLALSLADLSTLEASLKPIGLYKQRAKRLKNLAMEMVKRNDILPTSRADLESIPFMGQYIANAVELVIFKKSFPLLDVNMARVLERYFGKRKLADIRYDPYLQNLAFKVVNHKYSKEINWAILDFASLLCKVRKPNCLNCKFNLKCSFYADAN